MEKIVLQRPDLRSKRGPMFQRNPTVLRSFSKEMF